MTGGRGFVAVAAVTIAAVSTLSSPFFLCAYKMDYFADSFV